MMSLLHHKIIIMYTPTWPQKLYIVHLITINCSFSPFQHDYFVLQMDIQFLMRDATSIIDDLYHTSCVHCHLIVTWIDLLARDFTVDVLHHTQIVTTP